MGNAPGPKIKKGGVQKAPPKFGSIWSQMLIFEFLKFGPIWGQLPIFELLILALLVLYLHWCRGGCGSMAPPCGGSVPLCGGWVARES